MPRTSDEARAHLRYAVSRQLQAGHSQRSIARSLGISRKTVKKLEKELEQRREDGHSVMDELATGRTPRSSMLDPHIETICTWLEEARRKRRHLTATRILERLQKEQDFKGQYTIVAECVRELRKKIAPQPVTAVRHTYPPGQRAEFDWSPYQLTDELTVQTWHAVLCWSRVPSLEGWLRTTQQTIFGCLVRSFERWEGVPEECVTDTMPGVVDGWECDRPILNARMVDFAAHYGFAVRVARRATPKDKPRVERRFRYHEDDLLGGRKITTLEQYRQHLEHWQQNKVMGRAHPESGAPLLAMFREERPYLQSLPRMPYDTRDVQVRVVSTDGYVMLDTNQYAVPDGLVGDRLYICAGTDRVEICDAMARRIIEHERLPHGAGITLPQHSSVQRRSKYDLDLLVERLGDWDPLAREYARLLRNHRRYPGPELTRILELQLRWSLDDLVAAMRHAMDYGRYELAALERILQRRFQPRPLDAQISVASRDAIARLMETHPVSQRPISGYDHLDRRDGQQMTTQEHDDAQEDHAP